MDLQTTKCVRELEFRRPKPSIHSNARVHFVSRAQTVGIDWRKVESETSPDFKGKRY
jgi:hypothetical protein